MRHLWVLLLLSVGQWLDSASFQRYGNPKWKTLQEKLGAGMGSEQGQWPGYLFLSLALPPLVRVPLTEVLVSFASERGRLEINSAVASEPGLT